MKKIITVCVLLFSSNLFANELHFNNNSLAFTHSQPNYKATINYPQIQDPANPAEIKFNQVTKKIALAQLNEFKKSVTDNAKNPIPKEISDNGSTQNLTYELTSIEPHQFVSVRFSNDTMIAGAAHGSHKFFALNYDLQHNKTIQLGELFRDQAIGLQSLASLSSVKVTRQLQKNDPTVAIFQEGLTPNPTNYQVWNILPTGFKVTFNEYQVAAYVYGPQTVVVPFGQLQAQLNPNTPIGQCLLAKNCDIRVHNPSSKP